MTQPQDTIPNEKVSPEPRPKPDAPPRPKKPYEKPRTIYRAPLEAMAGTCSQAPGKIEGGCLTLYS